MFDFDFDDEACELLAQHQHQHRQQRALLGAPNCRDPEHPGCYLCEEGGEE
jgi:hypothetical protein